MSFNRNGREYTNEDGSYMITTVKPLGTNILERIGHTPLVRLEALTAHLPGVQILGKAEWTNPGGSVKDRAASSIVTDAQRRGLISESRGLLDATSGNTGIAYAMLGAAMGFPVTLCMPSNVSDEPGGWVGWGDSESAGDDRRRAGALLLCRPVFE
jgi:threonine dehydratase